MYEFANLSIYQATTMASLPINNVVESDSRKMEAQTRITRKEIAVCTDSLQVSIVI